MPKLCVLQPSYEGSESIIKDLDFARDMKQWLPDGFEVEYLFLKKTNAAKKLIQSKADVYLNLCDGAWDEDAPGVDVVQSLERLKKAFTGANSKFYDPTREDMKRICYYWQINTPRYGFAWSEADLDVIGNALRYPLFVKHYHGYNSVGITAKSKVHSIEELRERGAEMIGKYGGALIEEFVDGREFSVLCCSNPANPQEPISFKPVECLFDDVNFKTFDYKWNGAKNPWVPVDDPELAKKLQRMTVEMFLALGGEGYARTDIRMDAKGELYLLEINPNCSIFYPDDNGSTADVILQLDGTGKPAFLKLLIDFALKRARRDDWPYLVQLDPVMGNCMVAKRDIKAGELIYQLEEMPVRLVSKSRVDRTWNPRFKQFFVDFCYPISDDLWAMWDVEPDSWKPINHCCDPNAWVEGLDLVARRDIPKGQEITMDYGTMYTTENGPVFKCLCGAALCRGGWRPDDFRQPWFVERYGDHVTDHVRQKRKALGLPSSPTAAAAHS